MEIDTFNKFMVGVQGGKVVIMNPPRGPIERTAALVLAATIVALSPLPREGEPTFEEVLHAVENT